MTAFTRKNAWNSGGTFDNSDLLWYARGVGVMQSKALDDPNSWWFFAAIHGEYITNSTIRAYLRWSNIPPEPVVPTTPLPTKNIQDKFWKQCQHQSWYFPPWHRGYLIALEAQIRAEIIKLGGPEDWALPYWNYFGNGNQYQIPPAFTQKLLEGNRNPLFVTARYGPNNDGNVYVDKTRVNQKCQQNTLYQGRDRSTPAPGYGGPSTRFSHGGGINGNLEGNPHNGVHSLVGGSTSSHPGLMSWPGLAALDPIFYLHHCNIDRMWAQWNSNPKNKNPTQTNWLKGPAAIGQREFVMPMPSGPDWVYTPEDVDDLSILDYTYDDLQLPDALTTDLFSLRKSKLGFEPIMENDDQNMESKTELFGANEKPLSLKKSGGKTSVRFDKSAWEKVPESFAAMKASSSIPDQVFLQLENVKGELDATMLSVSVNDRLAGHLSLFGLQDASHPDIGHSGGSGLTLILDITDIIDELHLGGALEIDSLDVEISLNNELPDDQEITVGRVGIYREQQS